jgi:hypothetical protein
MHGQASMRTILRAYAAVMADDRLALLRVKIDRLHHAGAFTAAAPDTLRRLQNSAAPFSRGKRARRTNFNARRFLTRVANRSDKSAGQTAPCLDVDTAFPYGMIFPVYHGAN